MNILSTIVEIAKDVLVRIEHPNVQFFANEQYIYIDINNNSDCVFIDFTSNSAIIKLFIPQQHEEWGSWKNLEPPKTTYQTTIGYANPDFVDLVIKQINYYIHYVQETNE